MPCFRPQLVTSDRHGLSAGLVRELAAAAMHPAHFFTLPPLRLEWRHRPDEATYWELFRGRLLDATQTRERRRFEAWDIVAVAADGTRSAEPVVAVKYDAAAGELFVTRAVLVHGHETYDAGGNVIETREVLKWQRELVGPIRLAELGTAGALRDELACRLFQAIVGVSRLPLTSIESPLPGFALGQLGYFHRPDAVAAGAGPMTSTDDLLRLLEAVDLSHAERVKHLELLIRATPADGIAALAEGYAAIVPGGQALGLLRDVFNAVTLSPYTDFAAKALAFVRSLEQQGAVSADERLDFLAHLARQLGRHLTAYDLIAFHHRGANYPDALLLGELSAELFTEEGMLRTRLRRRALRAAVLLRTEYAGHPVPDQPTSPGENQRVLPAPFVRVPEEQIFSPVTRRRRLFEEASSAPDVAVREAFRDLDDPEELRELGTALYLDRPLGAAKAAGEPDQTLLTSHVLFSRSLAAERLKRLAGRPELLPDPDAIGRWQEQLRALAVTGLPLRATAAPPRPGVVSLQDALRVADDWLILRTTRQTLRDFQEQYDLGPLAEQLAELVPAVEDWQLLVPGESEADPTLCVYDREYRPRLELAADLSRGYGTRGGVEFPAAGLRVRRAWGREGAGCPGELLGTVFSPGGWDGAPRGVAP